MTELKVKSTVKPKSLVIAAAVINAANEIGLDVDVVITSGNDGKHMDESKHYSNQALDIRSKTLDDIETPLFMRVIRRRLGKGYQVMLENNGRPNEHIHVEYDP